MKSPQYQQLTLFAEASRNLANLTVLPGSDEARQITATSGRNISALLQRQDRDTYLPRMFLVSSPPISTRCYLTWKVKATPAGRSIFQLWPSMPRTGGSGSLLLPTPLLSDVLGGRTTKGKGRPNEAGLRKMAMLWPTPTQRDWRSASRITPRNPKHHQQLNDAAWKSEGQTCGQLNPTWVEALMGFPVGWSDIADEE